MTDLFATRRPRLIAVAYGMLGSMADAEDIAQDAWIRWQGVDHEGVRSPVAYLTTVITRMSIDRRRSAQHRRETYVGPWPPEPIVERSPDPADIVAEAEHFSLAFLHAMENLAPIERAVLLREGFDYDYTEIADIVDRSPETVARSPPGPGVASTNPPAVAVVTPSASAASSWRHSKPSGPPTSTGSSMSWPRTSLPGPTVDPTGVRPATPSSVPNGSPGSSSVSPAKA
jgi:RNA polymerase sigma factor (sigma-70 family)